MTTLFDATLALARILKLGALYEGTTTAAGSQTTLVDDDNAQVEGFFNRGTLWFVSGALAGASVTVDDYTESSKTFTFASQASAPGSGARYAVLAGWPRWLLVHAVNRALEEFGEVPQEDTSLTTVENQAEYTLPAGVHGIRRVAVATQGSSPYYWGERSQWVERQGKLIFDDDHLPLADGYRMRLLYLAPHAELTVDGEVVSDALHPKRLKWTAAVHAYRERFGGEGESHPQLVDLMNEAIAMRDRMARKHPVPDLQRVPRLAGWMGSTGLSIER